MKNQTMGLFNKTKNIELEIDMIPGDIDSVFESFHIGKGITISGLLGTDFLDKYGYVIDFKKNKVFHNFHSLSFREAMELIGIPCIVLWQNGNKYIFIIDTGSAKSHVHSKALETMDHLMDNTKSFNVVGAGGSVMSRGLAMVRLYYK